MKVAIVGSTGLVGAKLIEVLFERKLPFEKLILVASKRSVGKKITVGSDIYSVVSLDEALKEKPDLVLFSAGGKVSLKWAPKFAETGAYVVDNSSAWRMEKSIPLVVPEINVDVINKSNKIIANPNCSTIQLVMALAPLHKKYKITRLVISTYQSVTGTGIKAVHQLENERNELEGERAYPYPIDKNCIPHCDIFLKNSYTKEEMKLVNETRKILNDNDIAITATAVRVPVVGGHSESVNVAFHSDFSIDEVYRILTKTEGITVIDDIVSNKYPMPLYAYGKDDVFAGRIRRDESQEKTLNMWIVSDNLRKGAATNAVQIAEYLLQEEYILNKV